MKKFKLSYGLHSFILIPLMAITVSTGGSIGATKGTGTVILDTVSAVSSVSSIENEEEKELRLKAAKIDAYFAKNDMPLAGYGMKMVIEAKKSGIDPYLLAAISVRESTGGRHKCKKVPNQDFGWGGCKIGFESRDVAIEKVSQHLGGKHPNTDQWYAGKSTKQILDTYNTVIKGYSTQVMKIMDTIDSTSTNLAFDSNKS